ncbi:DNA polymerase beta domain protein region [Vulcanisaeta distributa DSM 14429]|uniref:DNA polymerase beta domain protein region n=2 Tax=Vulcanisaeta distributa TaxID=164451 RepID=E1QN97_VULDI|nr:DNA polymerase beta domain protein region [Vulcanisaeta distributa DSM 14429]
MACRDLEGEFGDEFLGLMLFGSWARGEAREDSDVDVMVLFNTLSGLDVRARAYEVLRRFVKRDITLVDMRRSELSGKLTALAINMAWDGVIICDRYGDLRRFKDSVIKFIENEGLVRYRTRDGKYGWMRADGRPMIKSVRVNV